MVSLADPSRSIGRCSRKFVLGTVSREGTVLIIDVLRIIQHSVVGIILLFSVIVYIVAVTQKEIREVQAHVIFWLTWVMISVIEGFLLAHDYF